MELSREKSKHIGKRPSSPLIVQSEALATSKRTMSESFASLPAASLSMTGAPAGGGGPSRLPRPSSSQSSFRGGAEHRRPLTHDFSPSQGVFPESPPQRILTALDDEQIYQMRISLRKNLQLQNEQMDSLNTVMEHTESFVNMLNTQDYTEAGSQSKNVKGIVESMLQRRETYAESIARAEGTLSIGPALTEATKDGRIRECFMILARAVPLGTDDHETLGKLLLHANPCESIEAIHRWHFHALTDLYSYTRDVVNLFSSTTPAGKSAEQSSLTPSVAAEISKGGVTSAAGTTINSVTRAMRRAVMLLKERIAALALFNNAGLDVCLDIRSRFEQQEASVKNLTRNSVLLARHARQLQIENEGLRAQLMATGATREEQEATANAIIQRLSEATNADVTRTIVMIQVENTHAQKLVKPSLISEALLRIHEYIDVKISPYRGRRVNYNSSIEPRDVFHSLKNPFFAPESYVLEFPSIGQAAEFCVTMQHDLAFEMQWPPKLLRLKDFKEVKDGMRMPPVDGETPHQRKRRLAAQPVLYRGPRVRMAIHIGATHVTRPFRPDLVAASGKRDFGPGGEPEDIPHLMGMAMDRTMQILRRARGGEILLSSRAAEEFDSFRLQYPEAFTNVKKIERACSEVKGDNCLSQEEVASVDARSDDASARFLRGADRLWAIISEVLSHREHSAIPYRYSSVHESVFPPSTFWRNTDALSSNLSIYAAGATATEEADDLEDDEYFLDEDDDDYIPAEVVSPDPFTNAYSTSGGTGGVTANLPGMDVRRTSIQTANSDISRGSNYGRPAPLTTFSADGGHSEGSPALSGAFGFSSPPAASPGTATSTRSRFKRRTTAEYEEILAETGGRMEVLTKRMKQLEDMNHLFGEEIESTRRQYTSAQERIVQLEKKLAASKKKARVLSDQLQRTCNRALFAVERNTLSTAAATNAVTDLKKAQLALQDLQADFTSYKTGVEKERAEAANKERFRSQGLQTEPDARYVRALAERDALAAALRSLTGMIALSAQQVDAMTGPSSVNIATGELQYDAGKITADLHQRMLTLLQGPTTGEVIGAMDDSQPEPASKGSLIKGGNAAKSCRWDDLNRLAKLFLQQRTSSASESKPQTPSSSRASTSGAPPGMESIDAAVGQASLFECLRLTSGFIGKSVKAVAENNQLTVNRVAKLQSTMSNMAAAATTRALESGASPLDVEVLMGSMVSASATGASPMLLGMTALSPSSATATAAGAAGGADGMGAATATGDMFDLESPSAMHLQRYRETERKVREQADAIVQYRSELARTQNESEVLRGENDVCALRIETLSMKAQEISLAHRNMRESLAVLIEKLEREVESAGFIKQKVLRERINSTSPPGNTPREGSQSPVLSQSATDVDSLSVSATLTSGTSSFRFPSTAGGGGGGGGALDQGEVLISKIFGDIQRFVTTTLSEYCSSSTAANRKASAMPPRQQSQVVRKSSPQRGGSVDSNGDDIIPSPIVGASARRSISPSMMSSASAFRQGFITYDREIDAIAQRSVPDETRSRFSSVAGEDIKEPSPLERQERERHRLRRLGTLVEKRCKVLKETETQRAQRDTAFDETDWGIVMERHYNRERYLTDQVRLLRRRNDAMEAVNRVGADANMSRSAQTDLMMVDRLFKKYDTLQAAGLDIDHDDRKRADADRDREMQSLLSRMRRGERDTQTEGSFFYRAERSTQTTGPSFRQRTDGRSPSDGVLSPADESVTPLVPPPAIEATTLPSVILPVRILCSVATQTVSETSPKRKAHKLQAFVQQPVMKFVTSMKVAARRASKASASAMGSDEATSDEATTPTHGSAAAMRDAPMDAFRAFGDDASGKDKARPSAPALSVEQLLAATEGIGRGGKRGSVAAVSLVPFDKSAESEPAARGGKGTAAVKISAGVGGQSSPQSTTKAGLKKAQSTVSLRSTPKEQNPARGSAAQVVRGRRSVGDTPTKATTGTPSVSRRGSVSVGKTPVRSEGSTGDKLDASRGSVRSPLASTTNTQHSAPSDSDGGDNGADEDADLAPRASLFDPHAAGTPRPLSAEAKSPTDSSTDVVPSGAAKTINTTSAAPATQPLQSHALSAPSDAGTSFVTPHGSSHNEGSTSTAPTLDAPPAAVVDPAAVSRTRTSTPSNAASRAVTPIRAGEAASLPTSLAPSHSAAAGLPSHTSNNGGYGLIHAAAAASVGSSAGTPRPLLGFKEVASPIEGHLLDEHSSSAILVGNTRPPSAVVSRALLGSRSPLSVGRAAELQGDWEAINTLLTASPVMEGTVPPGAATQGTRGPKLRIGGVLDIDENGPNSPSDDSYFSSETPTPTNGRKVITPRAATPRGNLIGLARTRLSNKVGGGGDGQQGKWLRDVPPRAPLDGRRHGTAPVGTATKEATRSAAGLVGSVPPVAGVARPVEAVPEEEKGGSHQKPPAVPVFRKLASAGSVIPYTLEVPPEVASQYGVHRRALERDSLANMDPVLYGALLNRAFTPTEEMEPDVARELAAVRAAVRLADADARRSHSAQEVRAHPRTCSVSGSVLNTTGSASPAVGGGARPQSSLSLAPRRDVWSSSYCIGVSSSAARPSVTGGSTRKASASPSPHMSILQRSSAHLSASGLTPIVDVSGTTTVERNEHGRKMSPVRIRRADIEDGGDTTRAVDGQQHSKQPTRAPNALAPASVDAGAADAANHTQHSQRLFSQTHTNANLSMESHVDDTGGGGAQVRQRSSKGDVQGQKMAHTAATIRHV